MKMMFQFQHPGGKPALETVQQKFGLRTEEIDAAYGVVLVDPDDSTYVIRVEETAQARLSGGQTSGSVSGFYSDPKIEPCGPPEA